MADTDAGETDSGLQTERTTMAWQRTALGIGAVSALLLHDAGARVALSLPGAGLLAALVLLLVIEARHTRSQRDVESGRAPMGRALVRAVSFGAILLALTAIAVVLGWGG